ncbi:MAG: hypothetical protein FWD66_08295 [Paludibacter sp.]|nr:hypothetical protein [Paludibacter sp.]
MAVLLFAAIMVFSVQMQAEVPHQKTDSSAVNCQKHCAEMGNQQCDKKCNTVVNTLNSNELTKQNTSAADAEIKLNFNFNHNKATFVKALDILGIGFSIVFVVMIIFIFVSKGIDKLFPYKPEDED